MFFFIFSKLYLAIYRLYICEDAVVKDYAVLLGL